jgi:hypothetical protein
LLEVAGNLEPILTEMMSFQPYEMSPDIPRREHPVQWCGRGWDTSPTSPLGQGRGNCSRGNGQDHGMGSLLEVAGNLEPILTEMMSFQPYEMSPDIPRREQLGYVTDISFGAG